MNVLLATTIVWFTLRKIGDSNPIWAIASMVAAADPKPLIVGCAENDRVFNSFGNSGWQFGGQTTAAAKKLGQGRSAGGSGVGIGWCLDASAH